MQEQVLRSQSQDLVWLLIVPKRQEFTKPKFHFGERVKWQGEDRNGTWCCRTGRIIGMHFVRLQREWQYVLVLDAEYLESIDPSGEHFYSESSLTLIKGCN